MTQRAEIHPAADDVVEAFGAAVIATGRSVATIDILQATWDAVDVGWAGTTASRVRLADALERLAASGVIELPPRLGRRWDTALPRLPTQASVPINRGALVRPTDPASEAWVPALSWAAKWMRDTRPPQRLRMGLISVNRWLAATTGRDPAIVSREERSLQIFGDEKILAPLGGTVLFAPGRLTLSLLRCEAPIGGIRVARIADRGPVLVVENKAIFDSAWRALRQPLEHASYAGLIFGGGDQAASLVPDLTMLQDLVGVDATDFEYAGDIDVAGILAAAAFVDAAREAGLNAGIANLLWLALGDEQPSGPDLSGDARERVLALDAGQRLGLGDAVLRHLHNGVRIPQERLDRTRLANTMWWAPSRGRTAPQ